MSDSKSNCEVPLDEMVLCSFPLFFYLFVLWHSLPLRELVTLHPITSPYSCTCFLLPASENSALRDHIPLYTFMILATESEAKEIMFEKWLLLLKGHIYKEQEGPKERNTMNEIYLIFQLLLLESNKLKFSTCQLIFSIKRHL